MRVGSVIAVSGTAPLGPDGAALHPGDVKAQTLASFARALDGVEQLGGSRDAVVRTRVFLAEGVDWHGAAEAHRELFAEIAPANTTLFVSGFIPDGALVEVEVDAIL